MINGNSVLAIIPARGGSKGVKRKNIRMLDGIPLIAWTILTAKKSKYIDRLILSSEDEEIINIARKWDCEVPFVRPAELAEDATPGIAPVLHALAKVPGYDYTVLLQPTTPLRIADDIDLCLERCAVEQACSCVSVAESDKSPFWMYWVGENGRLEPILKSKRDNIRRQDLPLALVLNGAVYVAQTDWLIKNKSFIGEGTIAYIMPRERSLDVDTEFDLWLVNNLVKQRNESQL